MFTWKHYVYEVYKEKSFSKAAQNLYISQPSLSARIKKIENEIGFSIFDRSTNPIQLTEAGKAYIKASKEIFQIEQDFENYINNLDTLKTGRLAIGASNIFSAYALPPIITRFKKAFPNVSVQMIEGNTSQLELMLNDNTIDFVMDHCRYDETLYSREYFCSENILLAVPKSFPINNKLASSHLSISDIKDKSSVFNKPKYVNLTEFSNVPFVMLTSGNDTRIRGDKLCNLAGFRPNVILELNQQSTAYMAASTQLGATFISNILVERLPLSEHLVYYRLEGETAVRKVFFYYRKNKYKTRVMQEFLKIIHI